jgi:hypothetical protein
VACSPAFAGRSDECSLARERRDAEKMDEMVRSMSLCNLKCQSVNLALHELQRADRLSGYDEVPGMPVSNSIVKPFCFRMGVKPGTPLYQDHGVDSVSVSVPLDTMGDDVSKLPETIEILLFCGKNPYYEFPGLSDVMRFSEVQDLADALDKLAQGLSFDDSDKEEEDDEDLEDIDE